MSLSTSSTPATLAQVLVLGISRGGGREELASVEQVDEGAGRLAGTTALGEKYR